MEDATVSLSDRPTLVRTVGSLIDTVYPHLREVIAPPAREAAAPAGFHRISLNMLSSNIRGVIEGVLEKDPVWQAMEVTRRDEIIDWFFFTFRPELVREVNELTIMQLERKLLPHIQELRRNGFVLPQS